MKISKHMPFDYKNIMQDSYDFASVSLSKGITTKFIWCRVDPLPPAKLTLGTSGGPVVKTPELPMLGTWVQFLARGLNPTCHN